MKPYLQKPEMKKDNLQRPGLQKSPGALKKPEMKKVSLQRPGLQKTPGALKKPDSQKKLNLQKPDCLKKTDLMLLSRLPYVNNSAPETPGQCASPATDNRQSSAPGEPPLPDAAGHASELQP